MKRGFIFAGASHAFFRSSSNRLFSVGANDKGQLSVGISKKECQFPTQVFFQDRSKMKTTVDKVTCSKGNSNFFLMKNGVLFGSGEAKKMQLGCILSQEQFVPRRLEVFSNVGNDDSEDEGNGLKIEKVYSFNSTFVTLSNGETFGFGPNEWGQLGIGHRRTIATPKLIEIYPEDRSLPRKVIVDIACGINHTIFKTSDGALYSAGCGNSGRCGLGNNKDIIVPQKISHFSHFNLQIDAIHCGGYHTLFLASNSNVFTCGYGQAGQLGHGTRKNELRPARVRNLLDVQIHSIRGGHYHSCFLATSGIYFCGRNTENECCVSSSSNMRRSILTPVRIPLAFDVCDVQLGGGFTLLLSRRGHVYATPGLCAARIAVNVHHGEDILKNKDEVSSVAVVTRVKIESLFASESVGCFRWRMRFNRKYSDIEIYVEEH